MAKIQMYTINRKHGSPYDRWLDCGKPPIDTYNSLEDTIFNNIKIASFPDYKYQEVNINQGVLNIETLLDSLEVKLIEIKLQK